jgi:hypothetical protein
VKPLLRGVELIALNSVIHLIEWLLQVDFTSVKKDLQELSSLRTRVSRKEACLRDSIRCRSRNVVRE